MNEFECPRCGHCCPSRLTDDQLHLIAAKYATQRKEVYLAKIQNKESPPVSDEVLNSRWLHHYEAYRDGYLANSTEQK